MGVQLREKKMKDGQISFYLDIYHNKHRWYEFLDIHISKTKPTEDDKEKKRLANEIKAKRENELTVQDNGLVDRSKRKADFVEWFEAYMKERNLTNKHFKFTLIHLKRYVDGKSASIGSITPEWVKGFTRYDYLQFYFGKCDDLYGKQRGDYCQQQRNLKPNYCSLVGLSQYVERHPFCGKHG